MYLTEEKLLNYLVLIFNSDKWEHDKQFVKGRRVRPDYRNEQLKMIVEFDGFNHYNSASRILSDYANTSLYESLGYSVIRIPYFVQMSQDVIHNLFSVDIEFVQEFPHGFISDKSTDMLPCDFNDLGVKRFKEDLEKFFYLKQDIVLSLKNKIEQLGDIRKVLPESLFYLVSDNC